MSNDELVGYQSRCSTRPLVRRDCERSDSWSESRDVTLSRILSAEEFLAVSRSLAVASMQGMRQAIAPPPF